MAIKKGICKNFGECSLADDKIVQEADSTNFVCEECGSLLKECEGTGTKTDPNTGADKGKKGKTVRIIVGCVAGLAILGGAVYAFWGGTPVPKQVTLDKSVSELQIGQTETLEATVTPSEAVCQLEWTTSDPNVATVADGTVTAVAAGTARIGVQVAENQEVKAACEYTVKKQEEPEETPQDPEPGKGGKETFSPEGTIDLGYASYQGDVKNGKPHGNGTMLFKSRQLIPGTKDNYAEKGEQVIGAFRDGEINMGTLYQKNGNRVVVKHK